MTLAQELQSLVRFYFVDLDFMQLVDSTFTVRMQHTGFYYLNIVLYFV